MSSCCSGIKRAIYRSVKLHKREIHFCCHKIELEFPRTQRASSSDLLFHQSDSPKLTNIEFTITKDEEKQLNLKQMTDGPIVSALVLIGVRVTITHPYSLGSLGPILQRE